MSALAGDNNWMFRNPCDEPEPIKPTLDQISDAMDELVNEGNLLSDYLEPENPDFASLVKLYHNNGGLPRRDRSERDDAAVDAFDTVFMRLLTGFRDEMNARGKLEARAVKIAADALQED